MDKKNKVAAVPMEQERPFYHILNHLIADGWTKLFEHTPHLTMWGKNGKLLLVQQMQPISGKVALWYPSEVMKLDDLKAEITLHGESYGQV
jgi:hypothetical protein